MSYRVPVTGLVVLAASMAIGITAPSFAGRLEFTYQLSERDVHIEQIERESAHAVNLDGESLFDAEQWRGAPALPAVHRTILLPPGTRVSRVTVLRPIHSSSGGTSSRTTFEPRTPTGVTGESTRADEIRTSTKKDTRSHWTPLLFGPTEATEA